MEFEVKQFKNKTKDNLTGIAHGFIEVPHLSGGGCLSIATQERR